jgi:hypothetical protein
MVGHHQLTHPRTLPFLYGDADGQRCTEMINEFLATKLPPNHNLWFQQDDTLPHTAVISIAVLHCLFPQQVPSYFVDVPPYLQDLTAPEFCCGVI